MEWQTEELHREGAGFYLIPRVDGNTVVIVKAVARQLVFRSRWSMGCVNGAFKTPSND
jgi:hypothetical protein